MDETTNTANTTDQATQSDTTVQTNAEGQTQPNIPTGDTVTGKNISEVNIQKINNGFIVIWYGGGMGCGSISSHTNFFATLAEVASHLDTLFN